MAMPRQSSMRNQRGKGFKVKHLLQIFVLVAICIWLLYQIKHSQDKKRAFEERGSKDSADSLAESQSEAFSFGRKDMPRAKERDPATTGSTRDEEEDRDDNELPDEEQEVKPTEIEEEDGEERGAEEDSTADKDQDMGGGGEEEEEEGHGEGFGGDEEKEDRIEATDLLDDQDTSKDSQEAREEHYRGDDVASAVHRDTTHTLDSELVMEDGASEEETNEQGGEDKELGTEDPANATAIASTDDSKGNDGFASADAMANVKPDVNGTAMAETNGSGKVSLVSEEKPPLDSAEAGSNIPVESQGGNSTGATESQEQMDQQSEATTTDSTNQSEVQSSSGIDLVTNQEQNHNQSATSLSAGGDVSSTAEEQTQEANSSDGKEDSSRNTAAHENGDAGGSLDGSSRADAISDDDASVAAIADLSKLPKDQTGADLESFEAAM